ncbi:MAG: PTS sugar transporter subunit IIC [Selenomonadaceae bacterium]|nr:PTS sugar transporter subunit IIC [Selenomonadaceae bacterium]
MKSFESVWEMLFIPMVSKFYNNKYLVAVRRSFFMIMPFLLTVVIMDVLESLIIDPWGLIMGNPGLNLGSWLTGGLTGDAYRQHTLIQTLQACRHIIGFGYGVVSILLTLSLSGYLSDLWNSDRNMTRFCAIAALLSLLPLTNDPNSALTDYFSERRFFSSIFVSFSASWIFAKLSQVKKLRLPVPYGLSSEFAKYLVFLPSVTINFLIFSLLNLGFTYVGTLNTDTFAGLSTLPLFQSPFFAFLYQFVIWVLWWFGLPGHAFMSVIQKYVYIPAQMSNQLEDTAYVFTSGFFEAGILHVMGLIIALLVFSEHETWRSTAKFGGICMLFNVQEFMVFGLPIMLNPVFLIPYIFAPIANTLVGWLAISGGIVPVFNNTVPWTMPMILSGSIGTGSYMGGILQVVWLVMDIFIYAPFVITANMIEVPKDEKGEKQNEDLHG